MRADEIVIAGLLAAAFVCAAQEMAVGQDQATTPGRSATRKAYVVPGDPGLLTPDMLTRTVDSRLFVDSFLVSLFTQDTGAVYDSYLHPDMTASLSREAFQQQVSELKDAVGPLTRIVLTYLREDNKKYDGADGGWSDHVLVCERDPMVGARVEFKRAADGNWKVIHSEIASGQRDRLQEAREAARPPAAGAADGSQEGGGSEPPIP